MFVFYVSFLCLSTVAPDTNITMATMSRFKALNEVTVGYKKSIWKDIISRPDVESSVKNPICKWDFGHLICKSGKKKTWLIESRHLLQYHDSQFKIKEYRTMSWCGTRNCRNQADNTDVTWFLILNKALEIFGGVFR